MSDIADLLAGVAMFGGLDRKHLDALARDFTPRTFPAGTVVVREGDERGIAFFVVENGEAAVTVGGKEVARVRRGDSFGEIALISDRVRTATVTAVTDLDCQVMTMWDFRAFVQGDSEVAWRLLQHVGNLLHAKS